MAKLKVNKDNMLNEDGSCKSSFDIFYEMLRELELPDDIEVFEITLTSKPETKETVLTIFDEPVSSLLSSMKVVDVSEPKSVLVTISGGVADLAVKPAGVTVEIRDYDIDEIDAEHSNHCKRDEDGLYQQFLWEAKE